MTINSPELGEMLMKLLLFTLRIYPLAHIHTYVNEKAAQGWANRGSLNTAYSVGHILQ